MDDLTQKQGLELLAKFRKDIIFFVNTCIIDPYNKATGQNYFITRQQSEYLKALCKLVNEKRKGINLDILGISVMSGKGTGKDAGASFGIIWFMSCFVEAKVPCISVSADQLDKVLWSEISKWLSHADPLVKEWFVLQNDKLFRKDVNPDKRGKEWFAFKKAANPKNSIEEQLETLAGCHAEHMLQIVDEGSGVSDLVYETLEKNMTQDCNLMLVIFNPMHAKGYAIDTQYKNKHRWITFQWNSEESEITNKTAIKRIEEDYGRDSNTYRMSVLGLPPIFDESTLINWEWVMAAIDRPMVIPIGTPLVEAMDCGAGGDKSVIGSRRGNKIFPFKRKSTDDSTELVNWAGANIDADSPDCFRVDTIGIGWAVEGALREKKGAIVEAADTRRQADNPDRFYNKRAEMYWNVRDLFEKGTISIPNDPDLKDQIAATRYEITPNGKIKIIDKKKIKIEIGHSPDEFDTLGLLYFNPDTMTSRQKSRPINMTQHHNGTWMAALLLLGLLIII